MEDNFQNPWGCVDSVMLRDSYSMEENSIIPMRNKLTLCVFSDVFLLVNLGTNYLKAKLID